MQVITVTAGNYLIPLLKEYVDYCGVETVRSCKTPDSSHSQWETELSKVFLPREPAFTFTNTGACCNKH